MQMEKLATSTLDGTALDAWRGYLQSHASILRELDAELVAEQRMTTRDYEVLLYLAQAPDRPLPMSSLAASTMLTRSGITRLVDGLVSAGWIERVACPSDARVSFAELTDSGYQKLREAGCTHIASIRRLFLEHYTRGRARAARGAARQAPGRQPGRRVQRRGARRMSTSGVALPARPSIHPGASMGAVRLTASDLGRSREFYERALGLRATELGDGRVGLAAADGPPLVVLHGDPTAAPLDRRAPGLFHLAVLMPTRGELAGALVRVARAGAAGRRVRPPRERGPLSL